MSVCVPAHDGQVEAEFPPAAPGGESKSASALGFWWSVRLTVQQQSSETGSFSGCDEIKSDCCGCKHGLRERFIA